MVSFALKEEAKNHHQLSSRTIHSKIKACAALVHALLLFDEHGVAVAEEAIAFLDGDFVDAEDVFAVVERGD